MTGSMQLGLAPVGGSRFLKFGHAKEIDVPEEAAQSMTAVPAYWHPK
jgi:hypothetical protein